MARNAAAHRISTGTRDVDGSLEPVAAGALTPQTNAADQARLTVL